MTSEQLAATAIFTLVCIIAAMGLWYLGLVRNSTGIKQIAGMVGLIPVLVAGVQFVPWWFGAAEYRTWVVGPTRDETTASQAIPYYVQDATVAYGLELTPEIRGGDPPRAPVRLAYKLRSPKGDTIAQGEGVLAPAQRLRWQPLRGQFQPREEGQHSLVLEIPHPVSSVNVVVREIRK